MKDILGTMAALRRPPILVRAARHGLLEYRRGTHLPRYLGIDTLPRSGPALLQLMDLEQTLEGQRKRRDAGYSAARHVDILIAMMAEARLLRASLAGQGQGVR